MKIISNKDQFIKSISHKSEIGINDRGDYTVIAYNVAFPDTFDCPESFDCRGIIFDNDSGAVIRRPFEKFHNINEQEYTNIETLTQYKVKSVTDKLDGTMIAPFINRGEIVWGTKRVASDFHDAVVDFLDKDVIMKDNYEKFVRAVIEHGFTPIFEFHDNTVPGTCIVIKYDHAFLRLIGVRGMYTGEYMDLDLAVDLFGNVPVVQKKNNDSLQDILDYLENVEGEEGRVVVLSGFGRVKIKSPWYFKRHKVKSMIQFDNAKAQLILNGEYDDLVSELSQEDRLEMSEFAKELKKHMEYLCEFSLESASKYNDCKSYGLSLSTSPNRFSDIVFRLIGNNDRSIANELVLKVFLKYSQKIGQFNMLLKDVYNVK